MKISIGYILNKVALNLVSYEPHEKTAPRMILDQIYFFEQSINNGKKNNIEEIFSSIFDGFNLKSFDALNEKIKTEKKSDFLEMTLFQIKHVAEFAQKGFNKEKLWILFNEFSSFYEESKPSDKLLDYYPHVRESHENRFQTIGCVNYIVSSLGNNFIDYLYKRSEDQERYNEKFESALQKFYLKSQDESMELQKDLANLIMASMSITNAFRRFIEEFMMHNTSGAIPHSSTLFMMIFAQFPIYFFENHAECLIKGIESLKSKDESDLLILQKLKDLKYALNEAKAIQGFAYVLEKLGIEVEEISNKLQKFFQISQLTVVEINAIEKHPNADSLNICTIFDGYETSRVVCGGKNVHRIKDNKLKTIFAQVGQVIPCDMLLEPREIRGVVSNGMLCSLDELCIDYPENEFDGIAELPDDAVVGASPLSYIFYKFNFFDYFDISITPNLGNLLGLSNLEDAIFSYINSYHQAYIMRHADALLIDEEDLKFISSRDKIKVEEELLKTCIQNIYSFEARDIDQKLALDLRAKNALVSQGFEIKNDFSDIINLIHISIGAYPHVIDLDKTSGAFEIKSQNNAINIVDSAGRIIGIPGVTDLKEFVLSPESKNILILFIVFKDNSLSDPNLGFNKVLQTARKEKIQNQMTYFYERGKINEALIEPVLSLAFNKDIKVSCLNLEMNEKQNWFKPVKLRNNDILMLFKKLAVLSEIQDEVDDENRMISSSRVGSIAINILSKLGVIDWDVQNNEIFKIDFSEEDGMYSILPVFKYRTDINLSRDLANEISKYCDFMTNQASLLSGSASFFLPSQEDELPALRQDPFSYFVYEKLFNMKFNSARFGEFNRIKLNYEISKILASIGYSEVCNFSFISPDSLGFEETKLIKLKSPVNKTLDSLRPSIIPSLLENLKEILKTNPENVAIFESGPVYTSDNIFQTNVTGLRAGKRLKRSIHSSNKDDVGFYDIKGDLIRALSGYRIDKEDLKFTRLDMFHPIDQHHAFFHPGKSAAVLFEDGSLIGYCGEIHPKILKKHQVETSAVSFVLLVENLERIGKQEKKHLFNSSYQSVERDLAFFFKADVLVGDIEDVIRNFGESMKEKIIRSIDVFDVYQDEKLKASDEKSVALSIKLQSEKSTLSEKDIREAVDGIIMALKDKLCGVLTIERA
jgi:phenylalanyl-tRNA synthetase beta chain